MKRRWIGLIGLGCAALAGCGGETHAPGLDPEIGMVLLRSGRPVVNCRDACLEEWRGAQPKAQQLAASGQWRDLALVVIGIGFQDDLTLYYLGQAAEGLGYTPAAISYYRQSAELSRTLIACARFSKQCGGTDLPKAALARVAALDIPVKRPRRAPASPPEESSAPAAAAPADNTPPPAPAPDVSAAGQATAAPAAEAPAAAPPPPPPRRETPAAKPAEDYIEPLPASR